LYDVNGRILVAYREERLLEGATLNLGEKGREFLVRGDRYPPGSLFRRL
jgi:hypothetical protein